MKCSILLSLIFSFSILAYSSDTVKTESKNSFLKYVNPLIGTGPANTISALKHGEGSENNAQVVPFVTVPFGMTNWTPQTMATEKKCIAPYYYKDTVINGFRGSHWLSGSCVQDYGSVSIMPTSGKLKCLPKEYGSKYSHTNEISTPYYYKVKLDDYDIDVEMTSTTRAGIFKFTFNKEGQGHILINPNSDEGEGYIKIIPEKNEIVGYNPAHRIYQGWGDYAGFKGYFVAKLNKSFSEFGIFDSDSIYQSKKELSNKNNLGAFISFHNKKDEVVLVKIGTSFTSIDEAELNLNSEINDFDFNKVKEKLFNKWDELLSKISVEGGSEENKTKFYTALYHSFLQPRIFNDADGSYMKFASGDSVCKIKDGNYYCDFSMWDIYRALLPLYNLIIPEINKDIMHSLLLKAKDGDWLPIFPCWNNYTSAMIGDHAISAISDAYIKDVINLSKDDYKYLIKNATTSPKNFSDYKDGKGRRALTSYLKYGFIPLEDSVQESFHKKEQVSRTLEYAYDDFALSRTAIKMGMNSDAEMLTKRAYNYKNVFDNSVDCVRGKYEDESWTNDFDKLKRMSYITEGTPWQYTFYVPQDMEGLIKLFGSEEKFNNNLDEFFEAGQYWHGNEPGHQIPFLYNYSGQPWKTQEIVSQIMNEEYGIGPGGLSGNDDGGQMSAWYVFTAIGFYPVCPSLPEYVISGPHFDIIKIKLNENKVLIINSPGASSGKKYISQIKINDKLYSKNYFNHFDLIKGGEIDFKMSDKPDKNWGVLKSERPSSLTK